jgi:hypothetical protein
MKRIFLYSLTALSLLAFNGCKEKYLNVFPEDRITSVSFWQDENDVKLALNGIYSMLRDHSIYGYGPGLDACTPNAYQWAYWEGYEQQIGDGSLTTATPGIVTGRWTACYGIISRVDYFLENIGKVKLDDEASKTYIGEAHFLRGVAYSLLAETYGGVPIVDSTLTTGQARQVKRSTLEQTWGKAISDYDIAIGDLGVTAPEAGRATLGAALGMKMRAYLYQDKYPEVLKVIARIDSLGVYSLYPSYHGMFQVENEDNQGVLFDVQFIAGENGQGSIFDRYLQPQNLKYGISGSNSDAPTQNLVDAYEMIDGSKVDPAHPYKGRDPRLDFTILRPGAYFQGQLYPVEIKNHTGQRVGFGYRKYTIENMTVIPTQSPLNYIVLRYADVILSKAEALIETGQDIDEAISLINRIRTEREDVKITPLPPGLSQADARKALRHERRIEFALEGTYWPDIKRWNIGADIYPVEVRAADGSLIETKFPKGYQQRYNLLPIPESEISLNQNLKQNPGW